MNKLSTIYIHLFLFLFLITSCSPGKDSESDSGVTIISNPEYGIWQDEENPVEFELIDEFSFTNDQDLLIGRISYLITDENSNIYIYDSSQGKLFSLDPEGKLNWETGQEGRGPGDFRGAYGMLIQDNKLFISNQSGTRLDVYDLEGNFLKTLNYGEKLSYVSLLGFLENGDLAAHSVLWGEIGQKGLVLEIDDSVAVKSTFTIFQSELTGIETQGGIGTSLSVYGNHIVSGFFGEYKINFYNRSGEVEKTVLRDFNKLLRPGISGEQIGTLGTMNSPIFMPNGSFIIRASWPDNISDADAYQRQRAAGSAPDLIWKNTFDLFDSDGTLLYSIVSDRFAPDMGYLVHIDKDGFLYFTQTTDFLTLSKYKLHFNMEN